MKFFSFFLLFGVLTLSSANEAQALPPYQTWQANLKPHYQQCIQQQAYGMGLDYEDVLCLYFFRDMGIPYAMIAFLTPSQLAAMGLSTTQRDDALAMGLDYDDLLC